MAHELDFSTGRAAIAISAGSTKPWHGFGFPVQGNDIIEWQRAAGLDWEVIQRPVFYGVMKDGKKTAQVIEDRVAAVRSDNQECLAVTSDRFRVVQPRAVLEFFSDLVSTYGFQLDVAGSLKGGRKIWALAKTGADFRIMGQDEVKAHLLLATAFDGSMATVARFCAERVVCANTLAMAMGEEGGMVKVYHRTRFDEAQVKKQLGIAQETWQQFEFTANKLAEAQVSLAAAQEFFKELLGNDAVVAKKARNGEIEVHYSDAYKRYMTAFHKGKGQDLRSARGTAWGLINGVTEVEDWHVRARNNGNRMDSAWFGPGAGRKQRAMELAQEMFLQAA